MPLFDEIKGLCQRIPDDTWPSYRSNVDKALRFYRGTNKSDMETSLRRYFPFSMDRAEFVADLTNFTRKIVDRAANLWDREVMRTYFLGDNEIPEGPIKDEFDDQEEQRTLGLQYLDAACYLFRSALLRVGWDKYYGRLSYHVIPPSDVWIVPSDDNPDEIQTARAIIYRLMDCGTTRRFCMWTPEYQLVFQGDSPEEIHKIEEDPSGMDHANPLGIYPFVMARELDAGGRVFPPYAEDLVGVAEQLSIAESLQTANVWWQSHGQMVVPEGTNLKQPVGRGVAWQEPMENAGATRFLTKQTPFTELTEHLQRKLRTLALSRDLPPNDFAFEGTAPESGFSKLMDSLPLLDLRQSRIGRVGTPTEQALVKVEAAILNFYSIMMPEGIEVETEFPMPEFPRSEMEDAQTRKTLREAQMIEIQMGILDPAEIIAEEKGITIEEAQAEIEERRGNEAEDRAEEIL